MKKTISFELTEEDGADDLKIICNAFNYSILIEEFHNQCRKIIKYDDSDEAEKLTPGLEKAREIIAELEKEYLS